MIRHSILERSIYLVYRTSPETQERKDTKRKHIIETAIKVFAARGYHSTTVKDIVDEAAISVGSFYFYFKSKEDIFETLYEEVSKAIFNASEKAIEGDYQLVQRFCRATTATLCFFAGHRDLARIMLIEAVGLNPRFEQKRAEIMAESANRMKKLFDFLQEKGLINTPDNKIAALACDGATMNIIMNWLLSAETADLTSYAFALAVFNLQALKIPFQADEVRKYIRNFLEEDFSILL
jgi:Transcriptional regulator